MEIVKIVDADKTKYMDLLLIADEQVDMIEKYLYRSEMFALCDNDVKAICVVTQEQSGVYEIKNIVTVPNYQRTGYGQHLISFIADYFKKSGTNYMLEQVIVQRYLNFMRNADLRNHTLLKTFLQTITTTQCLKMVNN